MGKGTYKGQAPKDDPMFSGGPQIFSPYVFRPSSKTSQPSTTEATPVNSDSPKPGQKTKK